MKKLFFLTLSLMAGFIASCGGGSDGAYSALFGNGPKALKPASICTVTITSGTATDIQNALTNAQSNNQDDVICIVGTYTISFTLTYTPDASDCGKKLTIKALDAGTALNGNNSVQTLRIDTYSCSDDTYGDITIEGITFQNGKNSSGTGGGLSIRTKSAKIIIRNNAFNNNNAAYGGGVYTYSDFGIITFVGNTFSANMASHGGGADITSTSGSITLTNNTFSDNRADFFGGGARVYSTYGSINFTSNTFTNNAATYNGGGGTYILSTFGSISVTSNAFNNNLLSGANVSSGSGTVTFINNTFSGNTSGGARVSSSSGTITLKNNTFSGNTLGGAIVSSISGSITFTNNTFSGNMGTGADAYSESGSVTLVNNTFSSNASSGAKASCNYGSITFINNTFSGNSSSGSGGGAYVRLYDNVATLHFYNNILWNNTADAVGDNGDDLYVNNDGNDDNTASPVNLAHNIFSTTATPIDFSTAPQTEKVYIRRAGNYNQNIANGCTNSGDFGNIQADPLFADADLRLQASSPAINAGCNNAPSIPNTDKDGNPRIVGTAVDMGAYEYQGQQQPQQYTLTVNKSGNGSGSISATGCTLSCTGNTCTCTANAGTQITLSASADQSSVFAGWSNGTGSASCTGTGQCTITLNQDSSITATFNLQQSGGGGGSGGGPIIIPPPEIQPPQTGPISDNATIPAPNQQGNISIQIEGATFIQSPTTITNIPPPPNNGATPYGAITFSAGLTQGQTQITVSITFPSIPQGAEFYKIIGNRYIRINPTVNGNTIIFVVVDNSELDANQQAGVISDPVVMVVPQSSGGTNQTGGGGAGGCSMGGTADASMLWWLVPPVLALARRLRRSAYEGKV